MHVFLPADDSEQELRSELLACFPGAQPQTILPNLLKVGFPVTDEHLPYLAFARQFLPDAKWIRAESIRAWVLRILDEIVPDLPEGRPWNLHIEPHYGTASVHRMGARAFHTLKLRQGGEEVPKSKLQSLRSVNSEDSRRALVQAVDSQAGRHRCELIREALLEGLQKKRRHLLRNLLENSKPFAPDTSLVQVILNAPDEGVLSMATAPRPFAQRHLISPFPKGEVVIPGDKTAPSRAFAKLLEAELRLGRKIASGEACVDLGAAPGSWSYIAAIRNAQVIAVDRSPLRKDLMRNPRIRFLPGDAFRFEPQARVDWLLCDVIAPPQRTGELLKKWLRQKWCRRFIVTLKLQDDAALDVMDHLKRELPELTTELFLSRLCANKKEACAFGVANVAG